MSKTAAHLEYADIKIGQECQFRRKITKHDVLAFATLTGDHNPLHVNTTYGRSSMFKKNIAHGMLASSLFSTLVGMYLPGEASLYLGQTLRFRKPVFPNDVLWVKGRIVKKNDNLRLLTLKTEIIDSKTGSVVIDGTALVKYLS